MSPNKGDRVALYVRVSTDKQVDEGHSLEGQQHRLEEYAERHGLTIVEVVIDDGKTGKTLDRPGMQRLIELMEFGAIDGVIAWHRDRVMRGIRATVDFHDLLQRHKVWLTTIEGHVDTSTPEGEFAANVLASQSQYLLRIISENTKRGMADARSKGIRLGRPPLGYTAHPDRKGEWIPTDDAPTFDARREAIRRAIERYRAEGEPTWVAIAARLNAESVPTVTGKVGTWDNKRAKKAAQEFAPQITDHR